MTDPLITVALIVKDEEAIIGRALRSARPAADRWLVIDTGSTDRTIQEVKAATQGWPGDLLEEPWTDFSTNRNSLLRNVTTPWVLLIDADHELYDAGALLAQVSENPASKHLAYTVNEDDISGSRTGCLRLVRTGVGAKYRGRVHEALHLPPGASIGRAHSGIRHHGEGSSRPTRRQRDIPLLEQDLLDAQHAGRSDDQARAEFYLGATYFDAKEHDTALPYLRDCMKHTRWTEEKYQASYMRGLAVKHLGRPEVAAELLLQSAQMRTGRYEAAFEATRQFGKVGNDRQAAECGARFLSVTPRPGDVLNVFDLARDLLALEASGAALRIGNPGLAKWMLRFAREGLPADLERLRLDRLGACHR